MAKKKTVNPIPLWLAIVLAVVLVLAIGVFMTYLFTSFGSGEDEGEVSLTQSFGEESSEAPSQVIVVKETMSDAEVGDAVVFGSYEQNGNTADGAETIEWIVLEKQDDKLLLISRYCIDALPYNNERASADWATSSLNAFLNGEFYANAFSDAEKTSVKEGENGLVTILSAEEATRYYEYDSWRAGAATEYAVSKGARAEDESCWWWLRDAGTIDSSAAYVHFNGSIQTKGFAVDYGAVAVRPVIWVSADAETETEHTSSLIPDDSSDVESGSDSNTETSSEASN